jgi:hypothetical protein
MNQATAALVGAAIGATTVFISSYLTFRYQLRLEEQKSKIAREDALDKELRSYGAEVIREMFSALHSMAWIAWHAYKQKELGIALINDELISQYHQEIHSAVPRLLGHLAAVDSVDKRAYKELSDRWDELQELENRIANTLVRYQSLPDESLRTLAEYHPEIMGLYKSVPQNLADIMKSLGPGKQRA